MSIGPVQMLIVGFEDPKFTGGNFAELERLRGAARRPSTATSTSRGA